MEGPHRGRTPPSRVGLTLTAFGAPSHAEGVAGITSEARAQDEVMNYAVNLPATASRYDFNAAVSKARKMAWSWPNTPNSTPSSSSR